MRDPIVALIILLSLPLCYRRPLLGLCMFSVLAYMRLQDLAWGFARFQRWSFYVAIIMAAGYLADRNKGAPVWELRTVLMVCLALWIGIGLNFSVGYHEVDIAPYIEYVKIIAIAVFTTAVVRTREHLRILMWVIVMCFAFFGAKNGLAGIASLGRMRIMRGPGGMLEDNNDFALAMAMSVPVLFHMALAERRAILRHGLMVMIPLCVITVALTQSRGGALSLAFGTMILVWRSKNRLMGVAIGVTLAIAGAALAPKDVVQRLETIKDYEQDGSAMGRLRAWKVAGKMIRANPMTGVGLERFKMNYLTYEGGGGRQAEGFEGRVAHNSYLQIWAECGTPAFLMYMSILKLTFIDLWRIRKRARERYHASWILNYATMFEASLGTFMLGSMFLNRAHFDLVYHYVAIVLVFGRIANAQMAKDARQPQRERPGRFLGGNLLRVDRSGFGRRPQLKAPTFRTTALTTARKPRSR